MIGQSRHCAEPQVLNFKCAFFDFLSRFGFTLYLSYGICGSRVFKVDEPLHFVKRYRRIVSDRYSLFYTYPSRYNNTHWKIITIRAIIYEMRLLLSERAIFPRELNSNLLRDRFSCNILTRTFLDACIKSSSVRRPKKEKRFAFIGVHRRLWKSRIGETDKQRECSKAYECRNYGRRGRLVDMGPGNISGVNVYVVERKKKDK